MVSESVAGAAEAVSSKQFRIRRVSLRRLAFEAPDAPWIPTAKIDWENVEVHVGRELGGIRNDRYELVLTLYVHATADNETVFRGTAEQIGVFEVAGYSDEEASDLLRTKGAEQVYPYARELILSILGQSGVQNLGLKPFSFDLPG